MEMSPTGWVVTAIAILLTGISKSGLGGALGALAVPFMSMSMAPQQAVAVMLPVLIAIDLFGIRAWRGKASGADLRQLLPAAMLGVLAGTLAFGLMSERTVRIAIGLIAVGFALDRLLRRPKGGAGGERPLRRPLAWLCGAGAGFTSTLAHAVGPPVMIYLLGRGLPRHTFVATSVFFFAVLNLAKLPFYVGLDLFGRETLVMSALLMPLVPVGVWLGMRLLARIPERPFFLFATVALALSGAKLLWDGIAG